MTTYQTIKNVKQAESPVCTKNRTHLAVASLQFHSLPLHNTRVVVKKMWVLQAYLASSSYTATVFGPSWCDELCFAMLSVPDSWRRPCRFQSHSRASFGVTCGPYPANKPLTQLFWSYFYLCFHLQLQLDLYVVHVRYVEHSSSSLCTKNDIMRSWHDLIIIHYEIQ